MKFCYIHPDLEAQGQCTGCNNWICSKDFNLVDEEIGKREEWVKVKHYSTTTSNSYYNDKLVTRPEYGPVIYCTDCFERKMGIKSELTQSERLLNPEKNYLKKRS